MGSGEGDARVVTPRGCGEPHLGMDEPRPVDTIDSPRRSRRAFAWSNESMSYVHAKVDDLDDLDDLDGTDQVGSHQCVAQGKDAKGKFINASNNADAYSVIE